MAIIECSSLEITFLEVKKKSEEVSFESEARKRILEIFPTLF